MSNVEKAPSQPLIFYVMCALALAHYVCVLGDAVKPARGGEASIAAAIQSLVLILALWIVLALLLVAAAALGEMPRWAMIALVPLHICSGVATAVALDLVSRHGAWAIVFPIALPLLTALYAVWARLPVVRARLPARTTSAAILGLIFLLSAAAMLAAM